MQLQGAIQLIIVAVHAQVCVGRQSPMARTPGQCRWANAAWRLRASPMWGWAGCCWARCRPLLHGRHKPVHATEQGDKFVMRLRVQRWAVWTHRLVRDKQGLVYGHEISEMRHQIFYCVYVLPWGIISGNGELNHASLRICVCVGCEFA